MRVEIPNCPIPPEDLEPIFASLGLRITVKAQSGGLYKIILSDKDGFLLSNRSRTSHLFRFSRSGLYLHWATDGLGRNIPQRLFVSGDDDAEMVKLVRHLDKRGPKWAAEEARQMLGEILFTRVAKAQEALAQEEVRQAIVRLVQRTEEAPPPPEADQSENKPN